MKFIVLGKFGSEPSPASDLIVMCKEKVKMSCEENIKNHTVIEGHRKVDVELINVSDERITNCINFVTLEIDRNHEWAMELRKKVGLQALIWPFILLGTAIASKSVNLGDIRSIIDSCIGISACIILFISFISLGMFYGFLERRLWERKQYLRRLFMSLIADNTNDEPSKELWLGCLTERDYKKFDMRGAYFVQYILVSCIVFSILVLMTFIV